MQRLVVDCSCLCYRSLFSMGDLSNDQKKVQIIFGFLRQIFTLAKTFNSNKFVFCWDSRNSYRKLIYPQYKSSRHKESTEEQRADMDDAFRQFNEIRELLLPSMGFKNIFQQSGYEADDLIAHIVTRLPDDTMIISTDNDLFQLIEDSRYAPIKVYNFKGITDKFLFKKTWYGLDPIKWAFVKAIAGCSTDEVKGIEGVGYSTAAKYLAGILSDGKTKEKIDSKEGKEMFFRNLRLVGLPYSGLKPIRILELQEDEISKEKFAAIFGQYGFRSLLKEQEIKKWGKLFFKG
jgi:5'-3' exonuclease